MTASTRGLLAAGVAAILIRLVVFAAAAYQPIVADRGALISPRIVNGTDLRFYQAWKDEIFTGTNSYGMTLRQRVQHRGAIAGPVYPVLLYLFDYQDGNSWPLALLFLGLSVVLCLLWLWWLWQAGLSAASLLLFAILPHPIYYMICVGTEIPFSLFFAAFFITYFNDTQNTKQTVTWIGLLLLLLLTRPNGLSLLVFVIVDQLRLRLTPTAVQRRLLTPLVVGAIVFGTFYYSYFTAVFSQAPLQPYFGITTQRFVDGLFSSLPTEVSRVMSLVLLLAAKTLYFLGIRPSHSNVATVYVVARVLPGLLFLIGLAVMLFRGDSRHRWLVGLFMVPILFVSSQDRYSVPIQPLLFFYCAQALEQRLRLQFPALALQPAA